MSIEIKVPDIGTETMEITEIMVKIGDKVKIEQSLLTVEGDKASIEIPSPHDCIIKEIKVRIGDKIKTGNPIMLCDIDNNNYTSILETNNIIEKKTAIEKALMVSDNSHLYKRNMDHSQVVHYNNFTENMAYVHATPVIRRLAREVGINLEKVTATGRKGRILLEDLQRYVKKVIKISESSTVNIGNLPDILSCPQVDFTKFGEIEEVELSRIQKISGANLSRNSLVIPHVTQFDETDITELEDFRKQQNREAEKKKISVKMTQLVFIMKSVASALNSYPRFNSSISTDTHRLIIKKYINIGVAVDTSNGLVVPVLRDVDKKNVIELSRELSLISKKAREGMLLASDMQGGCFTISSLGSIGGTAFTPIINAPEVAILGVSKYSIKPVWNSKEFEPRLILPLSLSFDHRVVDGAEAARFIRHICIIMEDIRRLIIS